VNSANERLEEEKRQILEEKNRFEEEIHRLKEEAELKNARIRKMESSFQKQEESIRLQQRILEERESQIEELQRNKERALKEIESLQRELESARKGKKEAEEVRDRLGEELEIEKKALLELQEKLEKTGRAEIGEKYEYKGKLIFEDKKWFDFFKRKCADLKIPSRHIMFCEDEKTCYISSHKILLFIGLRNDKYGNFFRKMTGFSDFSRNPEIGVIDLRSKSQWMRNQPYKEENYVTTEAAQKEFFDQLTPKPHPLTLSQEEPITDKILISAIYKDYSGAVIGERHNDIYSKKFIIDNIYMLKQKGVEVIYLEHLYYDVMQEDLDAYFS
jgi:biotin operon repressor